MRVSGNVYLDGARAFENEMNQLIMEFNPGIRIKEKTDGIYLTMEMKRPVMEMKNKLVTTKLLGKAIVPNQTFVKPDGSVIIISKDFLGKTRNEENPVAGPFENLTKGKLRFKVWGNK